MIALHKFTDLRLEVIRAKEKTFTGRVLNDSGVIWKKGEIGREFNKADFYIILTWGMVEEIENTTKRLKNAIGYEKG